MFISKIKIFVKAGDGGKGAVSFRREKYIPFGGPDGGDGGKGGNVIFVTDPSINTLIYFRYHRHFFAKNGESGGGSNCNGKNGEDIILKVPVGTSILDLNENILCNLDKPNQKHIFLKGGNGGIGNGKLATSTNRAPNNSIPPEKRTMEEIILLLTLQTDVGILGAPNGGKSSLINCLSRANSVVGDYSFTTINPILGKMYNSNISLVDLPGIIEGAHLGKGQGIEFLRHSEYCKIFLHVIDITNQPKKAYEMILYEINKYGKKLSEKPSIIVLNKIDLLDLKEIKKIKKQYKNCICTSTKTGEGIQELMEKIKEFFPQEEEKKQEEIESTNKEEYFYSEE